MKKRGAVLVEEVLLILIAVALVSAFALTISGIVKGAVDNILGFRNATNSVLNSLVEGVKQLIFG